VKTAEFAATEEIFCILLKESLRTVARAIISSSVSPVITTQLREEILKNITTRHLFLQDDTTYMRLRDTFDAFSWLCEFQDLVGEIRQKNWWRSKEQRDDIEIWTRDIYPNIYLVSSCFETGLRR
jgi:hypothetical protein